MTSSKQWLYSLPLNPLPRPPTARKPREGFGSNPSYEYKDIRHGERGRREPVREYRICYSSHPRITISFQTLLQKSVPIASPSFRTEHCLLHCPFTSKISVHFPERAYLRLTPSHFLNKGPDCDQSWFQLCLFRLRKSGEASRVPALPFIPQKK